MKQRRKKVKSNPGKNIGTAMLIIAILGGVGFGAAKVIQWTKPDEDMPISSSSESGTIEQETGTILEKAKTLNATLANAMGDCSLTFTDNLNLIVENGITVLGANDMQSVIIDGKGTGSITAQGAKKSAITPAHGGMLTFKNLTFYDNTNEIEGINVYYDYLWFGGELSFENCTFTDSIYLKNTTNAKFKDCTFKSVKENYYSVWIGNGTANFEDCTFTGYRGVKIHEFDESEDVQSVSINQCLFDNLSVKPGVAIGNVNTETLISILNSTFIKCNDWDIVGSLVGVDGIYECDTPRFEFAFEEKGNTVISE